MEMRTLQLVIQYDGARFAGWQRQPDERTVQGVLEDAMQRLCGTHVAVVGAGRTDAGVHALGQAAGLNVPDKWTPHTVRRALNAVLPKDVWIAASHEMKAEFHARYSAVSRSYRYLVGIGEDAHSPFRSGRELAFGRTLDPGLLDHCARLFTGDHSFRGFAVKGTAPETDDHHCIVQQSEWVQRTGGLAYVVKANRFLHHMVRFLVGTMLDVASGRRQSDVIERLLDAEENHEVSPPAPAHGLYLETVEYPRELYLVSA
ncbi:MAG TPA: tRNA pseudouridine(38-40) synthase TruA [Gemmatimonadaceae bacterium]